MLRLSRIRIYINFYRFPFYGQRRSISTTNIQDDDNVSLCVVGNGADGNPRSVFIDYNEKIFMFNCGEGLQRSISDLGFKASKIDTFFSTSNKWYNYSGLSSFLLARYDSGLRYFNISNSKLNKNLFKQCTMFDTKLKRLKFNYLDENNFLYENLSIKMIPINDDDNIQTIVYVGNLKAKKGNINLQKCFYKKVPRNLVDELKQNRSVKNQDGDIIYPDDVKDCDCPEQNFIIFECINENYLKHLYEQELIRKFLSKCQVIIHFTKDEYLRQKFYQQFFQQFNSSHHLLITEQNPSFNIPSNHRFQIQLNQLDSLIFPILRETNNNNDKQSSINQLNDNNVIYSPTGIKYIFRSIKTSEISVINTESIPQYPSLIDAIQYKDGTEREGIKQSIEELRKKQSSLIDTNNNNNNRNKYPEFLFLGTASSHSLPIRNVSGILVNIDEENSILLDCGENTYGQLLNFYGDEKIEKILKNLKLIFITHHHSDHHLGLINLLEKRNKYLHLNNNDNEFKKLWLLLPPIVHKFLKNINILNLNNYNIVQNQFFSKFQSNIQHSLNINEMILIPVDHCMYSYGITIIDKNNFKFVYSGDTKPCKTLIELGKNCHLLIHESTVEDNLIKFARQHFHSTISEAINVGNMMNAKFIILTHFSQRYGKLPLLPDNKKIDNVGLAFDNMIINKNQLQRIPILYDTLKCMYAKHIDRILYRTDVYQRKYNFNYNNSNN